MPRKDKESRREYHRQYMQKWYKKNRKKQIASNREYKKKEKKKYHEYRSTLACIACGEDHPACFDFHHRDPSEKETSVNQLIKDGYSFERIKKEIDKCDVLCANCHRKLHHEEV